MLENMKKRILWKSRLLKSPFPLYYLAKFHGLAPITRSINRFYPASLLDKLYPVVLAAIYLSMIPIQLPDSGGYDTKNSSASFLMSSITLAFLSTTYGATAFTLLTFMLMSTKIAYILNKLYVISNKLNDAGIEQDHEKFFKNIFITTLVVNVCPWLISIITVTLTPHGMNLFVEIVQNVRILTYLNAVLIFVYILHFITQRFTLVNEKLYTVFRVIRKETLSPVRVIRSTVFTTSNKSNNTRKDECKNRELDRIRKIEELHLELCDLVRKTTYVFSAPILSVILEQYFSLIIRLYAIYWILLNFDQFNLEEFINHPEVFIFLHLLKIVLASLKLFAIAYASATICRQGNSTKLAVIKLWNKFKPLELKDEFFMFSLQLMHNPVTVSAFGFFDLDYSCLYKILCAVLAYFIIMIQFDTSQ